MIYLTDTVTGAAITAAEAELARGSDLQAGVVRLSVSTLSAGMVTFTNLLLAGLGKRPNERDLPRGFARKWQRLCAWMIGEQIRILVVGNADNLTARTGKLLLQLQEVCQLDLCLIATRKHHRQGWRQLATDWGAQPLALDGLLARMPAASQSRPVEEAPFPPPPDVDFARFLNVASDEFGRSDFARIREITEKSRKEAIEWVASHPEFDEEEIGGWLRTNVSAAGSHHEAVCLLRGVEAGVFIATPQRGIQLDVGHFARQARLARHDDLLRGAATRLRWLSNNDQAAAGVVRILSHCAVEELIEMRVGDVEADGSSFVVAGRRYKVPEIARGILRTQLIDRAQYGATEDDPLFISEQTKRGRAPATIRAASYWLADITDFADVVVADRWTPRKPLTNERWLHTMGLRLFDLNPTDGRL